LDEEDGIAARGRGPSKRFAGQKEGRRTILALQGVTGGRLDTRRIQRLSNRAVVLCLARGRPVPLGRREITVGIVDHNEQGLVSSGALRMGENGEAPTLAAVDLATAQAAETAIRLRLRP
jgi:hypothetical protein